MRHTRKVHRPRRGHGRLGDLLKKAHNIVKSHKLISRSTGAIADALGDSKAGNIFRHAHTASSALGYGRRRHRKRTGMGRRRVHHRRGTGIKEWLGKANDWLKKNRVISTVATTLGHAGVPYANTVANVADKLGYGRRRGHGTMRRHMGRRRGRGIGPQLGSGPGGYATAGTGLVKF